MSEITSEELLELLDYIKEKMGRELNGDALRRLSKDDIDRLVEALRRSKVKTDSEEEPAVIPEEPEQVQEEAPEEPVMYDVAEDAEEEAEIADVQLAAEEETEQENAEPEQAASEDEFLNVKYEHYEDETLSSNGMKFFSAAEIMNEAEKSFSADGIGNEFIREFKEGEEDTEDDVPEEYEEKTVRLFESYGDDGEVESFYRPDARIRDIMNGDGKKKDAKELLKGAKNKLAAFTKDLKKSSKKFADSLKSSKDNEEDLFDPDDSDDFDEDEDEFEARNIDDITDIEEEEEENIKIADFSRKEEPEEVEEVSSDNEKTIFIEKPGIVIKKGKGDDTELEGAPIIMSADDALENDPKKKIPTIEKMQNNLHSKLREAQEDGQIILSGFENPEEEEAPEEIDEDKAEQELFEKRKKKIDDFVLFGDDDDPYGSESEKEKLGELFDTHDDRPRRNKEVKRFDGVEYEQTKDARRVQRYLNTQKKKSFRKVAALCAMEVLAVITGIAAASKTSVGGDRILTIFISFLVLAVSIAISGQEILENFGQLRKKRFNINTLAYFSAILCFIQTLLMTVLYFFDLNSVSVFACSGVGLLLLSEFNTYVMTCRTADAMEFCTGDNKDELYSIESVTDDKDVVEFGKYVNSKSPRIRYSCKTRFPAHLIEMCMSETSVDKRSRLFAIIIGLMSIVNLAVAWAVNKNFAVGFSAFTITFSLCVPVYGLLLVQLPLRWTNRQINRKGALVSSQDAVNELYRTNAVILDSRDLFDRSACEMMGFKDFKNVRMDDAMLYAAAMVIRSGGPLTGVFDQMVVNRRDILPTVKSFSYEEKMGVSGWIYNQKVILGNKTMMTNHNVEVPSDVDEDKYLMRGHEVMYLAIAHKLAAMIVVHYAPDKNVAVYLKKLRDSGVTVLVRNCDPNVTEKMITECYNTRLDNIRIISSSTGRVFKKYKARPKVATRAVCVHDGSTNTFIESLCISEMLHHTFKIADLLTYIGMGMSFAIVLILSALNVIADLPAIFVILLQAVISGAFIGVTKITGSK